MEKDILETIIAHKREEVARQRALVPDEALEKELENTGDLSEKISMRQHLEMSKSGIIAEFKRRSPSKGWINEQADAGAIPQAYQQNGASALSILSDETFFGGTLDDIRKARPTVTLPILRKDFIIDRYQLLQAKAVKANAVLLIAAALTPETCRHLAEEAKKLGLEVLLELHAERELDYINDNADMIGINNRNLGTFHTDTKNSLRLADKLPKNFTLVSESGISSPDTIRQLRQAGFKGFLIGETFMKTVSPGDTLFRLIQAVES